MPGHFTDRLAEAVRRLASPVVVGLDPRWDQLPEPLRSATPDRTGHFSDQSNQSKAAAYETFCRGVIDVVAPLVPAVKPQAAFFEELGPPGMTALAAVIEHAQEAGLLVILDGKRNDVGSTAGAYARGYLGRDESAWHADALTVNPYLGDDSLAPFVEVATERGAGVFVLVKTSNPGSGMLQDLGVRGQGAGGREDRRSSETPTSDLRLPASPLYRLVAEHVESLAARTAGDCGYGCVGAVVGATYPDQLAELRVAMPHTWLLIPGYGSQGGTASDVAGGFDESGLGAIVNNSRGIIFAHARPEYADRFGAARWQDAVEAATRDMITELRSVSSLSVGGHADS